MANLHRPTSQKGYKKGKNSLAYAKAEQDCLYIGRVLTSTMLAHRPVATAAILHAFVSTHETTGWVAVRRFLWTTGRVVLYAVVKHR